MKQAQQCHAERSEASLTKQYWSANKKDASLR
jgi:hypothetical protein